MAKKKDWDDVGASCLTSLGRPLHTSVTWNTHSGCKRAPSYVSSSLLQPVWGKTRGAIPQSDTNFVCDISLIKSTYVAVTRLGVRIPQCAEVRVQVPYITSFFRGPIL